MLVICPQGKFFRICPHISIFAPVFNFRYLCSGLKDYMSKYKERCILYPELSFPLRSIHLCQRSFYKIFVKFRNSKKNVLNIVLIIVNIKKDENKSLILNQFSLKNDPPPPPPHFLENYFV